MSGKKKASRRYAVCIKNDGNEASLERNKLYVVLRDRKAEADGLVRVIDEDGEDYLYPADWFVAVEVPRVVQLSLRTAS
jgi:archaellum component FlaG (FlaF/FlaG flagellin family)